MAPAHSAILFSRRTYGDVCIAVYTARRPSIVNAQCPMRNFHETALIRFGGVGGVGGGREERLRVSEAFPPPRFLRLCYEELVALRCAL